jgi:hypothetical protein
MFQFDRRCRSTRLEPDGAVPCDSDDFDGRDGDGISIAGGAIVGGRCPLVEA